MSKFTYKTLVWTKRFSDAPKEIIKQSKYYETSMGLMQNAFNTYSVYRKDGPAVIVYNNNIKVGEIFITDDISYWVSYNEDTGKITREEYNKKAKTHRENDLPAVILYHLNGDKYLERWFKDGKLHRENDLPAYIEYKNGKVIREEWHYNGEYHRIGNPAIVYHDPDQRSTKTRSNSYYTHGILYNENSDLVSESYLVDILTNKKIYLGPDTYYEADYYDSGELARETWTYKGCRHRETGPARIEYTKTGGIIKEEWYINGNEIKISNFIEHHNIIRNAIIYYKDTTYSAEYAKLMKEESKTMFD